MYSVITLFKKNKKNKGDQITNSETGFMVRGNEWISPLYDEDDVIENNLRWNGVGRHIKGI